MSSHLKTTGTSMRHSSLKATTFTCICDMENTHDMYGQQKTPQGWGHAHGVFLIYL